MAKKKVRAPKRAVPPSWMGRQFSKNVKVARIKTGWTLAQAAQRIGIGPSYLSMLERGLREPALSTVESIAKAYQCTLYELLIAGVV